MFIYNYFFKLSSKKQNKLMLNKQTQTTSINGNVSTVPIEFIEEKIKSFEEMDLVKNIDLVEETYLFKKVIFLHFFSFVPFQKMQKMKKK